MAHFHHFSISNHNQSTSNLVIFEQNTKAIALLFGLIFITFQSPIKINQSKSKYQGYSLTFWPQMAHFHHFSISSRNQSISNLVIFEQNTKAIALLFANKMAQFHHLSISSRNQSISTLVIFEQYTKAIALLFGQTWLISITFQSPIEINQFQIGHF